VLAGLLASNWGESRRSRLISQLDRTATIPVDERVVQAYARLRSACQAVGHALWDKPHRCDIWIAATAIALDAPLLAGDRIYQGALDLRLLDVWADQEERS